MACRISRRQLMGYGLGAVGATVTGSVLGAWSEAAGAAPRLHRPAQVG